MTNFFKQYTSIFSEDIYGNKAMVYHRTKIEDLISRVYTSGFKPGGGDMYGKGFYGTYDLKSQLRGKIENNNEIIPSMKQTYGDIMVKFLINSLYNFISFDYDQFLKLPVSKKIKTDKNNFIIDQLNYFGIKVKQNFDLTKKSKFSSKIALFVCDNSDMTKKVDGIIFTGSRDGKTLVCYNVKLLIPLSTSIDEGKSFQKYDNKSKEYLKSVFDTTQSTFHIIKKDLKIPNWFRSANKENEKFKIENENIIWENGTWKDGDWEGGIWYHGKFSGGTWRYGNWYDGEFGKYAIWYGGNWNGGKFYGTWLSGYWFDGEFRNGVWHDGYWEKGKIWSSKFKKYFTSYFNPITFEEFEEISNNEKELQDRLSQEYFV